MTPQRKYAFVGTSCTGKTTLLDAYRQRTIDGKRIALVEEAAKSFILANPTKDRFTLQSQAEIQIMALEREQKAQASDADIILCDRSVLDAVAYTEARGDLVEARSLLRRIESWLPTYTSILLVDPADIPYELDDIRIEDETKRQLLHDSFLRLFDRAGISYELLSGTLAERIDKVDFLISQS